ncbi:MAG: polysaccharide biosynthesis tyrosine autokinase [Candidatus Gorgyraea atricola]|nr:polysaccharide biosynthesis tyrosine autokinase [Candidatus Gorgyraea atricola]
MITDVTKNIHMRDYLNIISRRKWLVISFFLITVTLVTVTSFMQKKVYRATATVIVDVEGPSVLAVKDVVKLGETNYFAYRDYIETQQEIIRGRRTAYRVMKNLGLIKKEEFSESKDPIQTLLEKVKVELLRDTRIINVRAEDNDPNLASRIANEFAKVYVDSNIAMKMKMSQDAQDWLGKEVDIQKKKVREAELKLQAYKEQNSIVSIENQEAMIDDGLAKLNSSYLAAQERRIGAETTYNSLIDSSGNVAMENLPSLLTDNKSLQLLKDDYLKQEALLVEYKKIYKYKHPKMIKLSENIDYLKSRLKSEIGNEYNSAVAEEKKFKMALAEQKKEALGLERKIIEYSALDREVETNDRILEIVLNRLKETSISSQIQANNVRVQDLAEPPIKPIKPKKRINIILSMIVGLMGGIVLAFFRDYMDISLKNPNEIASVLQIPLLGSVPKVKLDGNRIRKKADIDRVVEKDSASLASEAYRSIRTNLLFSLNHSGSSKSIVVTSSVPKEGKSITAVNLALMIANSGERVLLVDADMRRPRLHTVFNDDNSIGLTQFLSKEADFESVVKPSGIDNLSIVTSGGTIGSSAELISSEQMKIFIEKASSGFSKIIFDTPPIALVTDAALLSSICTGVLLIAEGGRATKDLLIKSKGLLEKVDAKILGVIVNNISLTSDSSYQQYYYGKTYGKT